jgi:hypothetical protein
MDNIAYYVFSIAVINHAYLLRCTFFHNRHRLIVANSHHVDAEPDLDPAFYFYGDPDQLFTLMRIRIRLPKMMLIHGDPDPQH